MAQCYVYCTTVNCDGDIQVEKFLHWQARMPAAPPRGLARSPYMQSETTKRWVGEKRAGGVLLPAE